MWIIGLRFGPGRRSKMSRAVPSSFSRLFLIPVGHGIAADWMTTGTAPVKSSGALAFAPNGVLLLGDSAEVRKS